MPYKIIIFSLLIIFIGCLHAFVSKQIQSNIFPWWSIYLVSVVNATTYALFLKSNLFSIVKTSIVYDFFFNCSWFLFMLVIIKEPASIYKALSVILAFLSLIFMNL